MDYGIEGQIALVTGGARDVGREVALALAAEGARVAVNYNRSPMEAEDVVAEIKLAGGEARAYQTDVSSYDSVRTMVDAVLRDFGRIDILVNNAGLVLRKHFVDTTPEDWKRQIGVGLYGVIHTCHAVVPHMVAQKSGRIINLAGDSARVGESDLTVTAASRAGALALTKSLAKELGRANITVNAVTLGLIETKHTPAEWLAANQERIIRMYPLRRIGKATDVAPMIAFLASKGAQWITGQVYSVNGGFSMV